ncbi:hypothetical protein RRG08_008318 [Elysia crispata]|uniref:Uncharacterized protein n=1 Tax=Elysia crispata TaxID=231223 RepID=A0AAE1DIQ8_9GAST|nr:hypothetical protein RRG08_008318 [Elysia crispata]
MIYGRPREKNQTPRLSTIQKQTVTLENDVKHGFNEGIRMEGLQTDAADKPDKHRLHRCSAPCSPYKPLLEVETLSKQQEQEHDLWIKGRDPETTTCRPDGKSNPLSFVSPEPPSTPKQVKYPCLADMASTRHDPARCEERAQL